MRAANGIHRRNSSALSAASSATSADRSASSACLLTCYQGIDEFDCNHVLFLHACLHATRALMSLIATMCFFCMLADMLPGY